MTIKRVSKEELSELEDKINKEIEDMSVKLNSLEDDFYLKEVENKAKEVIYDEGFYIQTITRDFRIIGLEREDNNTTVHLKINHFDTDIDINYDIVSRRYYATLY